MVRNGGHGDAIVPVHVGSLRRIVLVCRQCLQAFADGGGSDHHVSVPRIVLYGMAIQQRQEEAQAETGQENQPYGCLSDARGRSPAGPVCSDSDPLVLLLL